MSEGQELQQQVRGQVMQAAQDFYGDSLSKLKGLLQSSREQLQEFAEQAPSDAQAQLQEMVDSYLEIEDVVDQSAQDQGIGDAVDQAAEAQEAAGQATELLDGLAENLAPDTWMLGEPATDEQGQTIQRVVDREGNIVETTLDGGGEVVEESLAGSVRDLPVAEDHETTTDEQGRTTTVVVDESGARAWLQLDGEGNVLDLQAYTGEGSDGGDG